MNRNFIRRGVIGLATISLLVVPSVSVAYAIPNYGSSVMLIPSSSGMDYGSYQAAVRKAKIERKAALEKARAIHKTALAAEVQAIKTACADERLVMEQAREAYRVALTSGIGVEAAKVAFEASVVAYRNARDAAEEYHAPDIVAANTAYRNAVAAANKAYKAALNAAKALR